MNRPAGVFLVGILCATLAACGGSGGNGGAPEIGLSQTFLSLSAVAGIANDPAPVMVNVTNSGTGGALHFTASSDAPWLTVTPGSGTTPQSLTITALLGNLTAGTYNGHITVTATGVPGASAVTVQFMVNSQPSNAAFWSQWGSNPQHTGMVGVAGQHLTNKLADITYDPFVAQEKAEFGGELVVHMQSPIVNGNDVYMIVKTGTYTSCNPAGNWRSGAACGPNAWNSMIWNERRYSWVNGQLTQIWTYQTDWVPEPNGNGLSGWEPVFHPVDANNFIYVPGAGGQVWKVEKTGGTSVSHINPFNGMAGVTAANTFVAGPLSADSNGNIYYNAIRLDLSGGLDPWSDNDVAGAWLVKIAPNDTASIVSFATLVPGAPAGTALDCPGSFEFLSNPAGTLPWPPAVNAVAPAYPFFCGSQRPGINVAPAIAPDGTIYTASRAHFDNMVSYLIAVNPNLTPKWAASLQERLSDGCGVLVPIGPNNATPNACRLGTNMGVDPTTNALGSGVIFDLASASPTVLPDGSVLFGTLDNYNAFRGHTFHFDSAGNFLNAYKFGWDDTPGVWAHNGTYSIVLKDNRYGAPQYCTFNSNICQSLPEGPFFITQVDPNMNVEWQFQNTTIDGGHPNGYEWCINMPAVDSSGNVFVNSEDGNIYMLPQGNHGVFIAPGGKLFLDQAVEAAYTPLAVGPDGKLYTQNNGHLIAVGN
ncbi:MAG: BACON domain-containing protein [Candidatus Acidiferrales bacterium]